MSQEQQDHYTDYLEGLDHQKWQAATAEDKRYSKYLNGKTPVAMRGYIDPEHPDTRVLEISGSHDDDAAHEVIVTQVKVGNKWVDKRVASVGHNADSTPYMINGHDIASDSSNTVSSNGGARRHFNKAQLVEAHHIAAGTATAAEVKDVQRELSAEGYDIGKYGANKDGVDGIAGRMTRKAIVGATNQSPESASKNAASTGQKPATETGQKPRKRSMGPSMTA